METSQQPRNIDRHNKELLATIEIDPTWQQQIDRVLERIDRDRPRYQKFVTDFKLSIPWWWIATIHQLEAEGDFSCHFANGDPLTTRTVNVPSGLPVKGDPPFTWEQGAIAVLESKRYNSLNWQDPIAILKHTEAWNGWGYMLYHPEINTPYLWSGTNHYRQGKYTSDGKWSAEAVSKQVGAVPLFLKLWEFKYMNQGCTIEITNAPGTWLKKRIQNADTLAPNERAFIVKGTPLRVKSNPIVKDRHYVFELVEPIEGHNIWCIYIDHAGLVDCVEAQDAPQSLEQLVTTAKRSDIDPNDKKAIQSHLARIGLLDPPIDGKWGVLSQSAWRAFCRVTGDDTDLSFSIDKLNKLANFTSYKDLKYSPANPADPENVLAVRAIERMVKLDMFVAISMGSDAPTFNLFYVSGIDPDGSLNSNALDGWNDLRFLVEVSQSGKVIKHGCWLATVDAGKYWRGSRRMNPLGALQVDEDKQFFGCSAVGRHGSKQYPALVQVGELSATRDRTGNGRSGDDIPVEGDGFGANDHHGYDAEIVGINSAGCCVGKNRAGHERMMALIKRDRRYRASNAYAWCRTLLKGNNLD